MAGELVERLTEYHRAIMRAPRVQTENGPGARFVTTYAKAHLINEAADRIEALERENAALRAERDEARKQAFADAAHIASDAAKRLVPGELPHGVAVGLAAAIRNMGGGENEG